MTNLILLALICISYGYVVWRIIRNATIHDKKLEDSMYEYMKHDIDTVNEVIEILGLHDGTNE